MASRWEQLTAFDDSYNRLLTIYQHFPIEVRCFLCTWFEENHWQLPTADNGACEAAASDVFRGLLAQLSEQITQLSSPQHQTVRMRLQNAKCQFQTKYQDNPKELVCLIQTCMEKEKQLLAELQAASGEAMETEDAQKCAEREQRYQRAKVNDDIIQQLLDLQRIAQNLETELKGMQEEQEQYILLFQENLVFESQFEELQNERKQTKDCDGQGESNVAGKLQDLEMKMVHIRQEKAQCEQNLVEKAAFLLRLRLELTEKYNTMTQDLKVMQSRIVDDELISWRRGQRLAANGMPTDKKDLDLLQQWCEMLAEVLLAVRQQIKKLAALRGDLPINLPPNVTDVLPDVNNAITDMLSALVISTFLVEQQPPQVLKKDSKFSATVRLLLGGKLSLHIDPPKVKATILSEMQVRRLLSNEADAKNHSSGTIMNNSGTMELQTPAVTEEKFCILFQSTTSLGGKQLEFQPWTVSLPVVVTVHCNQESNASVTILWDNAFSEMGRKLFDVPETVPWPRLAEQLRNKFVQMTDRGLTPANLDHLAAKIFNAGPDCDYSRQMVTWGQFNKETLTDGSFTFWDWFYSMVKVTKDHLKGPWSDGSIIGFISKTEPQEILSSCDIGTFLLRFSDTVCGGVSISWLTRCPNNPGTGVVLNLEPFVAKDLMVRGLGDRINDLHNLTKLYPDIRKDEAFAQYCVVTQDPVKPPMKPGYVGHNLKIVIAEDRWWQQVEQGR